MKKQIGRFTLDTAITFATRVLQLVLGIGASIIIARILGPQGKGIYSLAILLPSILVTFGTFGIGQASVFYVGRKKYSAKVVLGNNIALSLLLGVTVFFIGLMVTHFFSESLFPGVSKVYLFSALLLIPLGLFLSFVNYLLLGLREIQRFNLITLLRSTVFLLTLLILLFAFKFSITAAIIANILSQTIAAIILLYLAKKAVGSFYLGLSRSYIRDVFYYGLRVYLGNILGFLHYRADIFLINIFLNPLAVGFYALAVTLAEKVWLVSQSAGVVLFPTASTETDKKRLREFTPLVYRNILFLAGISSFLLILLSRTIIVVLYSEKFLNSVIPFQILLIGAVAMSGWRILANDLYGRGKPELNIYISSASFALNIILNVLWIPKFGIIGASWATSISYTFAFLLITAVYSKVSGNRLWNIIVPRNSDFYFYRNLITKIISR
jgi:O-antigen/teichoic acid export membrane protein